MVSAEAQADWRIRDASPLLTWQRVFAVAAICAYLAEGAAKGATWAIYANILSLTRPEAQHVDQAALYAGYVLTAAFWLCAFITLRLVYRLARNLHATGSQGNVPDPAWAVGCWFVPFVNLAFPAVVISRIWKQSFGLSGERDRSRAAIGWWWSLWIGTAILSWMAALLTAGSQQPDANVSRETHALALALVTASLLGRALCAMLLIAIFGAMVRAQNSAGHVSVFD